MTTTVPGLVLASGSPRRRELLAGAGLVFRVQPADIDEAVLPGEAPRPYVERLARAKAAVVAGIVTTGAAGGGHAVVLAADTTVDLDGTVLGKPVDAADALAMLRRLQGRSHRVHTGVAVCDGAGAVRSLVVSTVVTFRSAGAEELARYVATGEPLDKAGAYAVQGGGRAFVDALDGSETNVIGLPLDETLALLSAAGVGPAAP